MTRVISPPDGHAPSLPSNNAGPGGHLLVGVEGARPPAFLPSITQAR